MQIVGLRYVQPNILFSQLMSEVPGLKVSILPAPIDPKFGIDYSETSYVGGNGGSGQDQGDANTGDSGGKSGGDKGGEAGKSDPGKLGSGGSAPSGVVKTSTKSNSIPMKLLLRGSKEQIDAAKSYIAMVDTPPKQVAVELRVMELSREDALKVGLDWSVLTGGTLKTIRINNALGNPSTPGGVGADLQFPGGGTASIIGALDALSTRTNVLARPSILANDGVPTNMFVGDEVRYVKAITNASNGSGLQVVTDQVDVGVDFNVTARIGEDGNILLDLQPTLKVLQGFTDVPGGGQLPQTSRRSAATQMSIKSGETIAIGGLIQDQDRKVHNGIPFLKDLPLIGHLFGRTSNAKVRSEVVFFVTVKEVTEADRQGAANPRQAEKTNTQWPGNKDGKKGG
jgi:general secretion pathway protein D